MTLDELAQLEYDVQEALWYAYEQAPDELKDMGWVNPPSLPRLTLDQFKARIANRVSAAQNFRIPDASYKSFKRRE